MWNLTQGMATGSKNCQGTCAHWGCCLGWLEWVVVKNAALVEMGCRHAVTHRGNPTRGESMSYWNKVPREGKAHRHLGEGKEGSQAHTGLPLNNSEGMRTSSSEVMRLLLLTNTS